ncbi:MAG TPA: dihydrofolate reductase family protein [Dongiaceae bacterium]
MRKLILKMSLSVDGFVGGPTGEVDWVFKSLDEAVTAWIVETLWQAGVHIMGSRTFQDMAAWWPTSTEPFAPPMNEIPKIVFSRKGRIGAQGTTTALRDATEARRAAGSAASSAPPASAASWAATPVLSGDLATEINRLKQQPGKHILAHGGASFAQSLARLGLIDEYQLLIHPIALGRGLPLFSTLSTPLALRLVDSTPFSTGAVALVYRPAA